MKNIAPIIGITLLSICQHVVAEETGQFATLPRLDSVWELQPDPHRDAVQQQVPYRWCVFRNRETGDFLSFAALKSEAASEIELAKYADSAFEIFPNGQPVWTMPKEVGRIESLAHGVSERASSSTVNGEILHYCFVSDSPKTNSIMAHGRAWIQKETVFFIQHTSVRPITSTLLRETARDYVHRIEHSNSDDTR